MLTEQEVYDMLGVLFACTFMNNSPDHGWVLRHAGKKVSEIMHNLIANAIKESSPSYANPLTRIINNISAYVWPADKPYHAFLGKLAESGRPIEELVSQVIGLMVGSSMNYAHQVAHIVDFYLDDERAYERAEIIQLAKRDDAEAKRLIAGYVREGQRLNPQFTGLFRRAAVADVIPQGNGKPDIHVQPGDLVFSSFKNAHLEVSLSCEYLMNNEAHYVLISLGC